MNPQLILAVALGGALGSIARFWLNGLISNQVGELFPWGKLIINVTGSFLIGAFIGLFAAKWDLSQTTRTFLVTGICGGYTTFSSFSLDGFYLMERGAYWAAAFYIVGSVVFSIGALIAAIHLVRLIP